MDHNSRERQMHRGGILITTLVFAVVIATILAGLGTLIISYYSRTATESQYASAINLADAGANYELRRINQNVANADLPGSTSPPGTTVPFGAGTFRVYCTMSDGQTSWDRVQLPFCILSTGNIGAVSRCVKINVTAQQASGGTAAVFAVNSGTDNGGPTVVGDFGTDGKLTFNGGPTVTGKVEFNGPGSGWNSGSPNGGGSYTVVTSPNAIVWPTVSATAMTLFPATGATAPGGLGYLATHNDNSLASPPISGNSVLLNGNPTMTFYGKAGGANYYVTSMTCNGNPTVNFNNSAGPITIWQGTTGGSMTLNGGVATVKMSSDPTKAVRVYAASTSGVTLNGNSELDAGVYNVTGGGATITLNGTDTIYGTVIGDNITLNGNPTIKATAGYFSPSGQQIYSFNNYWVEMQGL